MRRYLCLVAAKFRDPLVRGSLVGLAVALVLVLEATGAPLLAVREFCASLSSRPPLQALPQSSPTE